MSSSAESSITLWILAALLVFMGAHVLLGWIRNAQELQGWRRWAYAAIGSAALASAQAVAITLCLAGEALPFPIGYWLAAALGLWLGAVVLSLPMAFLLAWQIGLPSALGAGALFALLAAATQVGWIMAIGARPGIQWQPELVVLAWVVMAAGFAAALAAAYPEGERAKNYRYSWRIGGAGMMALSFLAGFALVVASAQLQTQVGSIHRRDLSSSMLTLLGGGLLPLVLVIMIVDLEHRRKLRRRQTQLRLRSQFSASMAPSTYEADSTPPVAGAPALKAPPDAAPSTEAKPRPKRRRKPRSKPAGHEAPPAPPSGMTPEN